MDPVTMALAAGGSIFSGVGGMMASHQQSQAAGQAGQMNAMLQTIAMQQAQDRFNRAAETLSPYTSAGSSAINMLMKYLQGNNAQADRIGGGGGNLMSTFAPTMEQLEATPGYQFARNQGLGAMTNSAAAKGLGMSGNLVRGLGEYATGFASQTFNDQLNNYLKQNQSAFNMLSGTGQIGANAASALLSGTNQFNNSMLTGAQGVGNSLAGGIMGAANARAQGTNALFNGIGNAMVTPFGSQNYGSETGSNYAGLPEILKYVTGTGGNPLPTGNYF